MSSLRFSPRAARCCLVMLWVGALVSLLSGCGMLHGSAQIGPDLKPHIGTSISVPLGK